MQISDEPELTKHEKGYILNILNIQCSYKGEQITVQNACERICQTFVKSLEKNDYTLLELPQFIEAK